MLGRGCIPHSQRYYDMEVRDRTDGAVVLLRQTLQKNLNVRIMSNGLLLWIHHPYPTKSLTTACLAISDSSTVRLTSST